MRFIPTFNVLANAYCLWVTGSVFASAREFSATLEQGPWIASGPFLHEARPTAPENKIPFLEMLKEALVKGLNNGEHQKSVLKMQAEQGMKAQSLGHGYLGPRKPGTSFDANATSGTRWTLFKTAKTYAGKEIHLDFVPESIKTGFRFDPSAPKPAAATAANGPPITYGLILTNIEPSVGTLQVAAVGDEDQFLYFQNAPQAKIEYAIGPIVLAPGPDRPYAVNLAPAPEPKFNWHGLVPDPRLRGKFSPKGLPTPAKPLPDQTLSIEQVQGYYSSDIQFVNGLHRESVTHRLRLPVYERFHVYEEFSERLKPTKVVFTDLMYRGGFSTNLEHFVPERRYRAGFLYRRNQANVELFLNLPDNGLNERFARRQRWELNFLAAI